jgi:hypothetical protein
MGDPFAAGATQVTATEVPEALASTDDGTPGTFVELTEAKLAASELPRAFRALMVNSYTTPGVRPSIVLVEVVGFVIVIGSTSPDSSSIRYPERAKPPVLVGAAQDRVTEPREVVGASVVGASETLRAVKVTAEAEACVPSGAIAVTTTE